MPPMHQHNHHGGHQNGARDSVISERHLLWGFSITLSIMLLEAVGGYISGSLALLADAAHMLTDAAALFLAWWATRQARRQADSVHSYGYSRFQVLAAFINGLTLLPIAGWLLIQAWLRLQQPVPIEPITMGSVALVGLAANLLVLRVLSSGHQNLNTRSAALHVIGDLLGSVAAVAAAVVIWLTGWLAADPLLSVLVTLLIVRAAIPIIRNAAHVLLEGSPHGLDIEAIKRELPGAVAGVLNVHHVHAWMLTDERIMMTMHIQADPVQSVQDILAASTRHILEHYDVDHLTIQVEEVCVDE